MKSRGRGFLDAPPFFSAALPARKIVEFRAGQTIISQGDECTDVHYIDEGIVKLTSVSNRGRGAVLGILGSGDFFGESCISGQSVYLTSAIALVRSKVSIIRRSDDAVSGRGSRSFHAIHQLFIAAESPDGAEPDGSPV